MRARTSLCLLAFGLVTAAEAGPPAAAPPPAEARAIEYSLLQPGLSGKYFVVTTVDMTALSGFSNNKRTSDLRTLVSREGYDAPTQLAVEMQAALEAAGWATDVEPVSRGRPGEPGRLTRSDLPVRPSGRYLLDFEINYLGLAAASNLEPWEPMFAVTWRVLRPNGEIVVPSQVYRHGPSVRLPVDKQHRTRDCGLSTFASAIEAPASIWACLDRGFEDASRALVPMIREAHVKAVP